MSTPHSATLHPDDTLLGAFDRVASSTPAAPALLCSRGHLSYRELRRRSDAVARALLDLGVQPEEPVAVRMPRSPESAIALLGVLRAGGAYVPVDPAYPDERQRWMVQNAGARVVLTAGGPAWSDLRCLDLLGAPGSPSAVWDFEGTPLPAPPTAPGALLNILYTSGSTGRPKGVLGTHGAMLNRVDWALRELPFHAQEVAAHRSNLSFVDAGPELFTGLLSGRPTAVVLPEEQADLAAFVDVLGRFEVSRITVVPSILAALLRASPHLDLPALRLWITSGEALTLQLLSAFRASLPHATLVNLYGTTEVTGDVTCARFPPERPLPAEPVPIGHAMAGAELLVLDPAGNPVADGTAGELYAAGPVLAQGYHQSPKEEAQRFPKVRGVRTFRTGDLVRRAPDGGFEYLGRVDNLVKIRGVRVELEEVERTLRAAASGEVAAVLVDERLVLAVAATESGAAVSSLRALAEQQLPEVMRPVDYLFVLALPLSPNGKVDRKALGARVRDTHRSLSPHQLPVGPLEQRVAEVWAALVGRTELARDDTFTSLGGSSLGLAEMLLAFDRLPGACRVPMTLARTGTLAEVAAALGGAVVASADTLAHRVSLTPLSEGGRCADDVVALFVAGSADAAIQSATELPIGMDEAQARAFALSHEGVIIRLDGRPVGAGVIHPHPNVGEGVDVPSGAVQLDEWLLPEFRGLGLLSDGGAWPLLLEWLAARYRFEVSVVWEDHVAMLAILSARGYTRVGRSYWRPTADADGSEGFCEVWLKDLRAASVDAARVSI